MMSFFGNIDTNNNVFELGGEDLPPIPKNTKVLAICEKAENKVFENDRYINLQWRIHQPQEFNNRVIFQKLRVYQGAQIDKHRQMLAAIGANAGGKLFQLMQQAGETEPSDMTLQAGLTNVPMVLLLDVWEMEINGENRSGNWVRMVAPRAAQQAAAPAAQTQAAAQVTQPAALAAPAPTPAPAFGDFEDDIPFAPIGLQGGRNFLHMI